MKSTYLVKVQTILRVTASDKQEAEDLARKEFYKNPFGSDIHIDYGEIFEDKASSVLNPTSPTIDQQISYLL